MLQCSGFLTCNPDQCVVNEIQMYSQPVRSILTATRSAGWDVVDLRVTEAVAGRKYQRICHSTLSAWNDAESNDFALRDQGIVIESESCDVESWIFKKMTKIPPKS